ncbi:hypothetical protein GX586_04750 [bacterium]|nr:hypothetical protein [bacterium]
MSTPTIIATHAEWTHLCGRLHGMRRIAIDLESNGLHGYPARICLMQVAAGGAAYLVEPRAFGAGDELRKLFADGSLEKILHSCSYDVRSLYNDYQAVVLGLFDTAIAAQFLGATRLGLGNVMKEFLGIELQKSRALQKMDWSIRPLPSEAVRYAVNDVLHLERLRDHLAKSLEEKGRLDWVREEFTRMEALRPEPPEPPDAALLRMKGAQHLTPRQRAVLREVYLFREQLAHEFDRPPFKVMGNDVLLFLAKHPHSRLASVKGLSRWLLANAQEGLCEALARGEHAPPVKPPQQPRFPSLPWTQKAHQRLDALKTWRTQTAQALNVDPSILWPMASLERLALYPDSRGRELHDGGNGDVRAWQRATFASVIEALPLWS